MFLHRFKIPWGAVATLAGEGGSRLAVSLFQFLVANGLGPEKYGTLGITLAFALLLIPIADLGLNSLALRYLANNPNPASFRGIIGLKLLSTLLYLFLLGSLSLLNPIRDTVALGAFLAGVYLAATSLSDFFRQVLRAKESSVLEFKARLFQIFLFLPACLWFWYVKPGISITLLIYCLPATGLALAYFQTLKKVFNNHLGPDFTAAWVLLKNHGNFLIQAILYLALINFSSRLDLWLIDWGVGRASVGYYFAAYNLVFSGVFFGQALSAHMYPNLHRMGRPIWRLSRALGAHLALALFFLSGVYLWGESVFRFLFRAKGYSQDHHLFLPLGIILAVSVMNYLWLALLIGQHRQWIASVALIATISLKFYLGKMWVPVYGIEGMLSACLWTEIPICIGMGIVACSFFLKDNSSRH